MSEKPKLDLGVLEEDDEFEEFPVEGKIFFMSLNFIFIYLLYLKIGLEKTKMNRISVSGKIIGRMIT